MADRTVTVRLRTDYDSSGLRRAAGDYEKFGRKSAAGLKTVSRGLLGIGAAAGIGVGLAVKTFAEFDAKMSQVKSLSHATAGEMDGLRQAALTAGQDIGFSASQAADAETELVKAGVSVRDIMGGGLRGALTLAAAGQIDVADATSIAAIAMTQFGVAGSKVPHVADLLAAGADKALGGVGDLGDALRQGGLVASQFGLSIDDTVGTLSAFANAGLLGSDAGTSFKQMLLSLAAPSSKAADLMHQLGINAYDAQGRFVGIVGLAGQLHDKLGSLSQAQRQAALSTIFGSDAVRSASVLYQQGAKGIQGWIKSVNDQGFAAEQAAGKMDNLNGDLQKLRAAFENDLIKSGSGANSTLRDIVQAATAFEKIIGQIPAPVLSTGLALTALLGAGTLAGAGLLKVLEVSSGLKSSLAGARTEVGKLLTRLAASGPAGAKLATGLKGVAGVLTGPWGLAIGAGVIALGYFAAKHAEAKAQVQELTQAIQEDSGALGQNARQAVANALQQAGAYKLARQLGVSIRDVTDATLGNADATRRVNAELAKHTVTQIADARTGVVASKVLSSNAQQLSNVIHGQNQRVQEAVQNARDLQAAGGDLSDKQAEVQKTAADEANSLGQVSDAFNQAKDAASQFKDALDALNGSAQSEEETNLRWHDQLVTTRKELQHGAHTLALNTAEGRKNRQAILDAVKAAQDHAAAVADQTGSVQAGNKVLAAERERLIHVAVQAGLTRRQAERYIDTLLRIPKNVDTNVTAHTAAAEKRIKALRSYLASLHSKTINIDLVTTRVTRAEKHPYDPTGRYSGFAAGGLVSWRRLADGGPAGLVSGPGGPTDDRVPILASNREYVTRAWAVDQVGVGVMDYINRHGRLPGYAGGGMVQGSRFPSAPAAAAPAVNVGGTEVRVFIGDTELRGIVRAEIRGDRQQTKSSAAAGTGRVV